MFNYQQAYKRVCKTIKDDERFCLICNRNLKEDHSLSYLLEDCCICSSCKSQFVVHRKIYNKKIKWYVLYEYNEFIERLLFRYKEQKDIYLAKVFFESYKDELKELAHKYCICTMCSSDEKRLERGFEPVIKMLEAYDIDVYSPLYKTENIKQSSLNISQRERIKDIIQRKSLYSLPNKPILLIDDVCTSGNTIQRGIELLKPEIVVLLCANPKWIELNQVEKQKRF